MPGWSDFAGAEPAFADRARRLLEQGRHKTLATLRADGSPRISGIECEIANGQLQFGSMSGARKLEDLRRDPRFALHGPTVDPVEGREHEWPGEVKVAGRAVLSGPIEAEAESDAPEGEQFVADLSEVVVTSLDPSATKLVVESWTPTRGLRRVERD